VDSIVRERNILDARIGVVNVRNLRRVDIVFVALSLALAGAGLLVLYSASVGSSSEAPYYLKQFVWFCIGLVVAAAIVCIDYRFLVAMAPAFYVLSVGSLLLVMLFGAEAKGAERWLPIGPFKFQPSEMSKLALVFMLTWYLSAFQDRIRKLPMFLLAFVIAGIPLALILKQPSLSTAMVLIPIVFVMLFVAGCRWWHMVAIVLLGFCVIPFGWMHMEDYQKSRVTTFLDPTSDPKGKGWQPIQTKITVGSGGLTGKGFLQGTQTHLKFLPEHHTDFIFSLLAEEMGFAGAAGVLALFLLFLLRGLMLARDCPEMSGALLSIGALTILGFHAFINIAITIGLMPVTGLPLPFLSYGGSFYLTTMMCVGVLLSVQVRGKYLG